uniref:Uncharacterized protein n=1 Tax=Parascaris equorum TaxID=6256 RepID=A0A914S3W0_PAREQ
MDKSDEICVQAAWKCIYSPTTVGSKGSAKAKTKAALEKLIIAKANEYVKRWHRRVGRRLYIVVPKLKVMATDWVEMAMKAALKGTVQTVVLTNTNELTINSADPYQRSIARPIR